MSFWFFLNPSIFFGEVWVFLLVFKPFESLKIHGSVVSLVSYMTWHPGRELQEMHAGVLEFGVTWNGRFFSNTSKSLVEDVSRSKNPFWVQPEAQNEWLQNYSDLWVYWMAGTSQESSTEQQLGAYEMKGYDLKAADRLHNLHPRFPTCNQFSTSYTYRYTIYKYIASLVIPLSDFF